MSSHNAAGDDKRFAFEPGVKSVLVIQTGPEVALAKPTAKAGVFGTGLDRYLKEKRSTDAWVTMLEQTVLHGLSAEEVDRVPIPSTKKPSNVGSTRLGKREE
jgi:hypothetical protein